MILNINKRNDIVISKEDEYMEYISKRKDIMYLSKIILKSPTEIKNNMVSEYDNENTFSSDKKCNIKNNTFYQYNKNGESDCNKKIKEKNKKSDNDTRNNGDKDKDKNINIILTDKCRKYNEKLPKNLDEG